VFASVTPICSAIAMNRLLKTSSSTGIGRRADRVRAHARLDALEHEWSRGVSVARQPGSIDRRRVALADDAGPSIASPGRRSPRSYTARRGRAVGVDAVVRDGASGPRAARTRRASSPRLRAPDASTPTASITSALPGMRKPYCCDSALERGDERGGPVPAAARAWCRCPRT
jgi:hypothetical protein